MVGFSRLYCSILLTTIGVATFGLEPPMPALFRSERGPRPVEFGRYGCGLSTLFCRKLFSLFDSIDEAFADELSRLAFGRLFRLLKLLRLFRPFSPARFG